MTQFGLPRLGNAKDHSLSNFLTNSISGIEIDGVGSMQPRAQEGLQNFLKNSEMSPVITATHGEHGAGNKTHSKGSAYDARTRGVSPDGIQDMVRSALYSRPEAIGMNQSQFAPHMHVDYNGEYGKGLMRGSRSNGLTSDSQLELAAFHNAQNGRMSDYKNENLDFSNWAPEDYVPMVPDSIVPTPSPAPRSPALMAENSQANPQKNSFAAETSSPAEQAIGNALQPNRVKTTSITPETMMKTAPTIPNPTAPQETADGSLSQIVNPKDVAANSDMSGSPLESKKPEGVLQDIGPDQETVKPTNPVDQPTLSEVTPEVIEPVAAEPITAEQNSPDVGGLLSMLPSIKSGEMGLLGILGSGSGIDAMKGVGGEGTSGLGALLGGLFGQVGAPSQPSPALDAGLGGGSPPNFSGLLGDTFDTSSIEPEPRSEPMRLGNMTRDELGAALRAFGAATPAGDFAPALAGGARGMAGYIDAQNGQMTAEEQEAADRERAWQEKLRLFDEQDRRSEDKRQRRATADLAKLKESRTYQEGRDDIARQHKTEAAKRNAAIKAEMDRRSMIYNFVVEKEKQQELVDEQEKKPLSKLIEEAEGMANAIYHDRRYMQNDLPRLPKDLGGVSF